MSEPTLDAVKEDDKGMVRDVLRIGNALSYTKTWTVNIVPKGYEILCYLDKGTVDVLFEDLELFEKINPLRVQCMGVRVQDEASCIRVRVISLSEPCMLTDQILVKTRKRSRWSSGI